MYAEDQLHSCPFFGDGSSREMHSLLFRSEKKGWGAIYGKKSSSQTAHPTDFSRATVSLASSEDTSNVDFPHFLQLVKADPESLLELVQPIEIIKVKITEETYCSSIIYRPE